MEVVFYSVKRERKDTAMQWKKNWDFYDRAHATRECMEKIDLHHLAKDEIPKDLETVTYRYNEKTKKWSIQEVVANGCEFIKKDSAWVKIIPKED